MTIQQVEKLFDEYLDHDCEQSAVISQFTDGDLVAAHQQIFDQYAYELALGACEDSRWIDDALLIGGNSGPTRFVQAVFSLSVTNCPADN